jgi:CO/xanthine dehydrogenase FAD-binding subunit
MMDDAGGKVMPFAGGTDLMVDWHLRNKEDWSLLDLSGLRDELGRSSLTDESVELGALTTYWDVIQSPDITEAFPLLVAAARQVGAIQIQTRGTWAGNIANGSPAADGVPVLMAYDAVVELASTSGTREVALDAFYHGYKKMERRPNELIVAIRMTRRPRRFEWFHKVGARTAQAITKVGVAVVHDDAGWRVVTNSVAPFVCRCKSLEAAFAQPKNFASAQEIAGVLANDISPIDDMRSTAKYRTIVLSRLLYHALQKSEPRP